MQRLLLALGFAAIAALAGAFLNDLYNNPMAARRSALEDDLAHAVEEADDGAGDGGRADYAELQKIVESRLRLWEPLVPPPVVVQQGPSLEELVKGIEPPMGRIRGANPRVKLRTPEHPQGKFFGKGDTVRPASWFRTSRRTR
jgi:hypothetical protein